MSPIEFFIEPFAEFGFMRRALAACLAISLGSAPLGVILVLRRMSLMGDAMTHALLPGVAIAFLFVGFYLPAMILGGFLTGLLVAFASGAVARSTVLREDASLVAFYLISLALGVLLVSSKGGSVDLLHVLFGSVLAVDDFALYLVAGIASVSVILLAVIYRPLMIECFDPAFLAATGGRGALIHMLFLTLMVLNLIGGFTALGTLMVVGIMMMPAVAARFWAREVSHLMVISVFIGAVTSVIGLLVSYHADLPSGPAIILTAGVAYMISLVFGTRGSLIARYRMTPHLEG